MDLNKARELHFRRMQRALEDGLKAIESARTRAESDAARQRAQARMEELNRLWDEAFGEDEQAHV